MLAILLLCLSITVVTAGRGSVGRYASSGEGVNNYGQEGQNGYGASTQKPGYGGYTRSTAPTYGRTTKRGCTRCGTQSPKHTTRRPTTKSPGAQYYAVAPPSYNSNNYGGGSQMPSPSQNSYQQSPSNSPQSEMPEPYRY